MDYTRILDTNLNRCKEGLRVIEDTARFIFEDEDLYKKLREIRHSASAYIAGKYAELLEKRDSIEDSGRTAEEKSRANLQNIVIANFKRVQEALRVLEEYSKIINFETALKYKTLRYEVYSLEKEMFLKYKGVFDDKTGA